VSYQDRPEIHVEVLGVGIRNLDGWELIYSCRLYGGDACVAAVITGTRSPASPIPAKIRVPGLLDWGGWSTPSGPGYWTPPSRYVLPEGPGLKVERGKDFVVILDLDDAGIHPLRGWTTTFIATPVKED